MTDGSQRREYERRRWPDERIDDLASMVRAFGPTVSMAVTSAADIEALEREVAEIKTATGRLDDRVRSAMESLERRLCERIDREAEAQATFRGEYRENREEDARRREEELQQRDQQRAQERVTGVSGKWLIRGAVVSGTFLVLATLITALVTLLGGSPS